MKICENGVMRDATQEEIAAYEKEIEAGKNAPMNNSERLDALEAAIKEGLRL